MQKPEDEQHSGFIVNALTDSTGKNIRYCADGASLQSV